MAAEPVSLPTTEELRSALEQAAEWIARYLEDVDRLLEINRASSD